MKNHKEDINIVTEDSIRQYADETFSRAFPSIHDGLKLVHRRIIYALYASNISKITKSAKIIGDLLGNYHPHGDTSVYGALVKMSSVAYFLNYPYIETEGNFGEITGDSPAAYRYTGAKYSTFCYDVFISEIDKYSIDYIPTETFDGLEPKYLPSKLPVLLLNGSFGIGQAFTVSIPPHNLDDVINLTIKYVKNKNISINDLVGDLYPDFPTGGEILNQEELKDFYYYGNNNKVVIKSKIELDREKSTIKIIDIPYSTNYGKIKNAISAKVNDGNPILSQIESIYEERDPDHYIMNSEIICKKSSNLNEILNELLSQTPLLLSYPLSGFVNDNGNIKKVNVKDIIKGWYNIRCDSKKRRYTYLLTKLEKKKHINIGLLTVYDSMDKIIEIIKLSKNKSKLVNDLSSIFNLSMVQSQAISEMPLYSLSRFSKSELIDNINKANKEISELESNIKRIDEIIIAELNFLKNKYSRKRRTITAKKMNENGFSLSQGVVLASHTSISLFDSKIVSEKSIMNGMKITKINNIKYKDIISYHKIDNNYGEKIKGILVFYDNGIIKYIENKNITINNWIYLGDEKIIQNAIPYYEKDNKLFIISNNNSARIVDLSDENIGKQEKSFKNVKFVEKLSDNTKGIFIINKNMEYMYLNPKDIPILSRNSIGVKLYMKDITGLTIVHKEDNTILFGMKNKDNDGFIGTKKIKDLNFTTRNRKKEKIYDIPNLYAISVDSFKHDKNSVCLIIGKSNVKKYNVSMILNFKIPKRISMVPYGAVKFFKG